MTKRILVIDDEKNMRVLLETLFSDDGYEVVTASDGQIGFNKAVTEDFDLITCDIRMPEWNGIESIKCLSMVENQTPIIVISGYLDKDIIRKLKEHENVRYIFDKPTNLPKLMKAVKAILDN